MTAEHSTRPRIVDFAVVGAGPAGLAAAVAAADAGARVAVLDLAPRPGGQIWRHPDPSMRDVRPATSPYPTNHRKLLRSFELHCDARRIAYLPEHAVWRIRRGARFELHAMRGELEPEPAVVDAASLLIATGAYDRQLPFLGWTLPGVIAAGGAQALLKGNRVAPGRRAVVAGSGPLLLAVAHSLMRAGVQIAAIIDAALPRDYARSPLALACAPAKLAEAGRYFSAFASRHVALLHGNVVVAANGSDAVQSITIAPIDANGQPLPERSLKTIDCDLLAIGYGLVPQIDLALELGCETQLERSGALALTVDERQQSSVPGVFAAGESTGVGGAELALVEGMLAGDAAAQDAIGRSGLSPMHRRGLNLRRARLQRFADGLTAWTPNADAWRGWTDSDTVVCRCEGVTVGEVTEAVKLGATDPRATKLLTRAGMGRCQGRICAHAIASLTAHLNGRVLCAEDLAQMMRRPIAQPLPLAMLAATISDPQATQPAAEHGR